MARLEGKVAFITGAARGQGRSHAVRLAREGARIIGLDLCGQIPSNEVPLGTREDLDETVRLVKDEGSAMVACVGDVREIEDIRSALNEGMREFGRLDIVLANAGICSQFAAAWELDEQAFRDTMDVNFFGVWNALRATVPMMLEQGEGGAIVVTSSGVVNRVHPNIVHYNSSKYAVFGLMRTFAYELAEHSIRVNAVLPGNVNTLMLNNEFVRRLYVPGSAEPTEEEFREVCKSMEPMPIPWLEPSDVSEAILYLVSDAGRYVTGSCLTIDAGHQLF